MNDSTSFRRLDSLFSLVSEEVDSHLLADLDHLLRQVDGLQEVEHGLGAHAGVELITVLLDRLEIHLVGQQLTSLHRRHAWVDDDKGFEVKHALDLAQRHVQHEADTGWQ